MIDLIFNLTTSLARLTQATVIKAGGSVPVRVSFSAPPPEVGSIQVTLGSETTPSVALAALGDFTAQSATLWTGVLDAADLRLLAFMSGKSSAALDVELRVELGGDTIIAPNVSLTIEPPLPLAGESSPGPFQPLASALTTLSTLPVTAFGGSLLGAVDAPASRLTLGLSVVENTALSTWHGSVNLTATGTLTSGAIGAGFAAIANARLANSTITIGGTATALGGSISTSTILDALGSTRGSVLYRSSAGWTSLLPGAIGTVLKSNGSGTEPSWQSAAGFADPGVFYVRSTGDDSTATGAQDRPFRTAQQAFVVGVEANLPFVIDLGVGQFSITCMNSGPWVGARGKGAAVYSGNAPTFLQVNASASDVENEYGLSGGSIQLSVNDLNIEVFATGGNTTYYDAGEISAGDGGSVELLGQAVIGIQANGGYGQGGPETVIHGGRGGNISLYGPLKLAVGSSLSFVEGSQFNSLSSDGGTLRADGCDLRGSIIPGNASAIELSRCSYNSGLMLTDLGGCAAI